MPGIFGGIGCGPEQLDLLGREFSAAWPDPRSRGLGDGVLGGHAFPGGSALHELPGGAWLAVDGERGLYRAAGERPEALFHLSADGLETTHACRGNLALLDPASRTLHLATEWTGTFPLFYAEHAGGLLFSSLLRPLARAVQARPDDLGVLQFLRQAYTYAARTQFQGIRRLLPGQSLRFRDGTLRLAERSRAWAGVDDRSDAASAAEQGWALLRRALEDSTGPGERTSLMMSAGWDSRTLFAAAQRGEAGRSFSCYSHGDVRSRELGIVEDICRGEGVPVFVEPIDDRVWDVDALQHGFARVGNVVFPHWHRAGRVLADAGVRSVFAGVYGEVLGGHYGPAMLAGGGRKVARVAGALLRPGGDADGGDLRQAREALRSPALGRHWYLRADYEDAIPRPLEAVNGDIETALDRLEARGVSRRDQLIEAFVAEHRGTQYINAQILGCRAEVDVVLPFADREALLLGSRIPLPEKIHNRVNREMLRRFAPALLRQPLAATLVSAGAPLVVQEASRLVRSVLETARRGAHYRTNGIVSAPRLGWVNFEFLRSGRAINALIDDLRCDIWDREALRARATLVQDRSRSGSLHPLFDQFSKIYTVDLLLR